MEKINIVALEVELETLLADYATRWERAADIQLLPSFRHALAQKYVAVICGDLAAATLMRDYGADTPEIIEALFNIPAKP